VGLGLVCCEVGENTNVAPKLLLSALCGEVYSILNKVSKLKLNTVIKVLKRHSPIFIAVQFSKHLHRDVSVKLFGHRFIKKLMEVLDRDVTFVMAAHQFP
jgi:5'(3')-deoxyribonucleotidase